MNGSSLVEFLCAISLLLVMIVSGLNALDLQGQLMRTVVQRTRPEEESNYRRLVIRTFFSGSAERLRKDPFLEQIPLCFPDLEFGNDPVPESFSIIQALSDPWPFVKQGSVYLVPPGTEINLPAYIVLAGKDASGVYGWNFARVRQITILSDAKQLELDLLIASPDIILGSAAIVGIHGFTFSNRNLYWITPAGQTQPFLNNLDDFRYEILGNAVAVFWRRGLISSGFEVAP